MGKTSAKGALTPGGRYFVGCWTLRVFLGSQKVAALEPA
jgi:hypothetical protein